MILGEGGFVLVVTEGTFGGRNTSFYDLFRVQSGKIAEHWDVVEEIPAKSESKKHKRQVLKTGTLRPENLGTTQQMKLLSLSQVVGGCFKKEQKHAIRKAHNDFKTGVPIEYPRNRSRNGLDLANPS